MNKIIIFLIGAIVLCVVLLIQVRRGSGEDETVHTIGSEREYIKAIFLDVGHGDATYFEFPNRQQMIVDCGEDASILESLGNVMPFYDHTIDYMVISHPHKDHFGGCIDVLDRFDVSNIVISKMAGITNNSWDEFLISIQDEGATINVIDKVDTWNIGDVTLDFLYPDHSLVDERKFLGSDKEQSINNSSIVFKLSYGEQDLLMTGDMEHELENYLIHNNSSTMDVEMLKAGHHGRSNASGKEFLSVLTPEHTFVSCASGNEGPSERVMRRLDRVGSNIWRTDELSDIIVLIYEDEIVTRKR